MLTASINFLAVGVRSSYIPSSPDPTLERDILVFLVMQLGLVCFKFCNVIICHSSTSSADFIVRERAKLIDHYTTLQNHTETFQIFHSHYTDANPTRITQTSTQISQIVANISHFISYFTKSTTNKSGQQQYMKSTTD